MPTVNAIQKQFNALISQVGEKLDLTHPDLDSDLRDSIAELLTTEVLIPRGIADPATLPPADWKDLVQSAIDEIESFGSVELRPAGENSMACEGFDLVYLLNTDEGTGPDLYRRLNLTATQTEIDGLPMFEFAEIDEEEPYLLTWPEGEEDFLMPTLLSIAPLSRQAFEDLAESGDEMCSGECGECPQTCPGKE